MKFDEYIKLNEKIKEVDGKFLVTNNDGSKILGTHSKRVDAIKQLQAIEINKEKDGE